MTELKEAIERAEHDYRVGNTVNPNDFEDMLEAARQHLADAPHIEAILEARKAATEGEWRCGKYSSIVGCPVMAQPDKTQNSILIAGANQSQEDGQFITTAANSAQALIKNRGGQGT